MLPIPISAQSITQRSESHHQGDNGFCLCISLHALIWILCARSRNNWWWDNFHLQPKQTQGWRCLSHYLTVHVFLLITDKHTDWWQQSPFVICLFECIQRNYNVSTLPLCCSHLCGIFMRFCFCWCFAPPRREPDTAGRCQGHRSLTSAQPLPAT